ncbi:MAG: Gfo/Idh/MocA family oxidoreductase [Paludibacteraceae bacterium]|nr:Gfo/Idh/MocA family oxidoreductase [Paludibacteraceae bacterium]
MSKVYKWGIIGAGHIAGSFAKGLKILPNARCYAIASRDGDKAKRFAAEYGFEKDYDSYQAMLNDPQVDIVYVATPNNLHYTHTMMALDAGKHVLCEKPFALTCSQAMTVMRVAREKKLFLMEALWSRFLPSMTTAAQLLSQGVIGKPQLLQAEFGIHPTYNENSRLFDPKLGGGSIADIGIYPIFLALFLFGDPLSMDVSSIPAPTGVDMTTSIVMTHKEGRMSVLTSSFAFDLESDAKITGDAGRLRLCRMFHTPTKLMLRRNVEEAETEIPVEMEGNGYNYEAAEVMRCIDEGKIESDVWSHSQTLRLLDIVERATKDAFLNL